MENTLVVAFDGLDYELIKKFDLEHIPQKEFGKVDNQTEIRVIATSELFASFITGQNFKQHGVTGLTTFKDNDKALIIENLISEKIAGEVKGLQTIREILKAILKPGKKRRYKKSDLQTESFFEKIPNSRAMFVPSYNPSIYWYSGAPAKALELDYSPREAVEIYDDREHSMRRKNLFSELESDILEARPLLMCHIHRSDFHQHMYGDPYVNTYDEDKLRNLYNEIDEFAKKIKEKGTSQGYESIIFMSDHGLPSDKHKHNENAFYSSNKELFGEETPHITDFHDKIIELTGSEE